MWRNADELLNHVTLKVEESIKNGSGKAEVLLTDSLSLDNKSLKSFFVKKMKISECAKQIKARFMDYVIFSRIEFGNDEVVYWKLKVKKRP